MKLYILNKETQEPALVLDQDEYGLSVVGGDSRLVQALKLNQFHDLKSIADYLNQDPNGPYAAQFDEDKDQDQEQDPAKQLDERIKPALSVIKEMMGRVKQRQDQDKAAEAAKAPEAQALNITDSQVILEPGGMIYVSYDGDNIGNAVARAERKDDENELRQMSAKINAGQTLFKQWAQQNGGDVIEQGGDEGLAKVPNAALSQVESFRAQYAKTVGATCSIGIGKKISEATDARMLAKLKGKNRSEMYADSTRQELKLRLEDKGDAESKKIADALETDPTEAQPVHQSEQPAMDQGEVGGPAEQQASQPESQPEPQPMMNSPFSPELVQAMKDNLAKQDEPKPQSLFASAQHDPDIEAGDYSDSMNPDFAKALRYIAKYGERP